MSKPKKKAVKAKAGPPPAASKVGAKTPPPPKATGAAKPSRAIRRRIGVLDLSWHVHFINQLLAFPNVTAACAVAGVSRKTAYEHRSKYPEFAEQWAAAEQKAVDDLEQAVWGRAKDGVEKPVYQGGELVGTVREFSDSLAALILKGRRSEIYGDKSKIEHSGGVVLTDQEIVDRGNAAEESFLLNMLASAKKEGSRKA